MEERYKVPALAMLPVVAAGVFAVMGGLSFYTATQTLNETYRDTFRVRRSHDLYAGVRADVPLRAVMGYLTDVSVDTDRGKAAFFASQYALAPRLLVEFDKKPGVEFVVGNFEDPGKRGAVEAGKGLTVVKDYGNGLVLYKRGVK